MGDTPVHRTPARATDVAAHHLRLVDPSTGLGAPANFGDCVTLRSGGPVALVVAIDNPAGATIAWRQGARVYEAIFDRRCLRPLGG